MKIKKWVWQDSNFPNFPYNTDELIDIISELSLNTGRLNEITSYLEPNSFKKIQIEAMSNEILSSNEIEGNYLDRESVVSSVKKAIDPAFDSANDKSTHNTDALVQVIQDAALNYEPLTRDRLCTWHNALFPTGQSGLIKIKTGEYREDEMQIVSNPYGREKIHYIAPPPSTIEKEMNRLLDYITNSTENRYIKSAKAHIWFLAIHPFDDGNGRLARVISDYILIKETKQTHKYYSISSVININKKSYYDILEKSNNLIYNRNHDFTQWVKWYLQTLLESIVNSIDKTKSIIKKAKLWDRINKNTPLNQRQIKVLNKIASMGEANFTGGLSTKKYQAITKTSRATAIRDIQDLVQKGFLEQVKGTSGRSVRYMLVYDVES